MLEENAEEMKWVQKRKDRLTNFRKQIILAWGTEDERVARE